LILFLFSLSTGGDARGQWCFLAGLPEKNNAPPNHCKFCNLASSIG